VLCFCTLLLGTSNTSPTDTFTIKLLVIYVLIIALVLAYVVYVAKPQTTFPYSDKPLRAPRTCSKQTCGAIDPVNDPDYNMRNIVKQSILLEEHLAERNKYCVSCIVKHFLHIIGLAEEAIWLAGAQVEKYPYMLDSAEFYQRVFDIWLANKHNDKTKRSVLASLRERRRMLIESYYLTA